MAVVTTYVISSDETFLDLIEGPGQRQVDVTSLSGGRLAVTSTNGTTTDLDIINANGTDGGGYLNFSGTLSSVDELTNGNIVVVVEGADGTLYQSVRDPNGGEVLEEGFFGLSSSDPDVAAISNGNYILASVVNSNIRIGIPQSPGVQTIFTLDSGAVDERPSVTGLDGGGYAVAWSATRNGLTEVWYAVYENTGQTRLAPTKLADTGTVFHDVSIASTAGGGFAIAYEDNGIYTDVLLTTFNSVGSVGVRVNVSNPGNADASYAEYQPYVTRLGSGLLAIAYTRDYVGQIAEGFVPGGPTLSGFEDDDTLFRIYDPTRNVLSDAAFIDAGQTARNHVQDAVVADYGAGRIAAFHTNLTANDADGEIFNVVRRSVGDGGNDVIVGDALIDDMRGGGGNDTYFVHNVGDIVVEAAGQGTADRILSSITYTMAAAVEVELLTTTNASGTGAINLTGNGFAQTLGGNAGANVLNGKGGADTMHGFAGNDWYYVDNVGDAVIDGAGQGTADRVFASVSFVLTAGAEIEILSTTNGAGTAAINFTGNGFSQSIGGNGGDNVIYGGGGNDSMVGFAGDDRYFVDSTGDSVLEQVGGGNDRVSSSISYTLTSGQEIELFTTTNSAGFDSIDLTGNNLAQSIGGNAGANVLNGGLGNDTLTGFAGLDTFFFNTAFGPANVDRIADFNVAQDTIRLENAIFAGLANGVLAGGAFNTGSAATQADDRIIYNATTGALIFDANGFGGAAGIQFATLSAGLALTSSDFVVV